MKLYQGALVITTMLSAALAIGCGKGGSENNNNSAAAAPADNGAAATDSAATPPVSDTDTTAETAPAAPPAPPAENPGPPPAVGETYVQGTYRYQGGKYVWGKGHWEKPKPGVTLVQAKWEEVGGKWVHHPARFTHAGAVAAPHPAEEHPAPKPGEKPGEHPAEHH
jgi:hypothetical protein